MYNLNSGFKASPKAIAYAAIICSRGGYGTVQIIDKIDYSALNKNPKWIVGYSDITVLHSHLHKLGFSSLHASMPINFQTNTNNSIESLRNSLFNDNNTIETKKHQLNKLGKIEAEVVGGVLWVWLPIFGINEVPSTTVIIGGLIITSAVVYYGFATRRIDMNIKT